MNLIDHPWRLALLLSVMCTLCAQTASAQRYSADTGGDQRFRIESREGAGAHNLIVLSEDRGTALCEAVLPSSLFSEAPAEFSVETIASNEAAQYVSVKFARGRVFTTTHEVVVRIGDDATSCRVVWQSTYSEAAAGERLIPWPANANEPDNVALVVNSDALPVCGPEQILVQARVYDASTSEFVTHDWSPELREPTPVIEAASESLPDRFEADAAVQFISSDATASLFTDPRAVPRALTDGNIATVWREGEPGAGEGSFLGGSTRGPVQLAGVRIETPPQADGSGVDEWVLRTESRDYRLISHGTEDETFLLPEMIASDCFVLFADRVQDDASTIVIGEFSLITALDADALSTSIAGILESVEQDAEGGWSRTAAIDVLGSGDEEATRELAELLPDAEFRERSIIVEALASSEQGRAELIELIRARELSERELERIAQVIRQRGIATDFVFEALRTANPEVIDSLLAFLVGSIPPQDAPQLLPWAGHPTPASVLAPLDDSPDVAEGLGRAPPSALGAYLNALDGRPGHDSDILRAILIIAKREGAAERSLALPNFASSQIESTLDNRNGTVVRLALAVAGYLQLESLLDKIIDFARSDPHPEIRSAAVSSLQYLSELDADAANTAVQALFDDYPNVRMAAADTLKQLSLTDEQVGELGIALEEESWPEVRTRMMSALASQASRAASIRLIQYLEVAPGREVRQAMIAVQNREQGLPGSFLVELFEAHEGDLRTQISVVRTMSSAEGDVASEFLQRLALNEDASLRLRQAAIESLGRNRQIAAVAEMILLLDHEIARLRRSAARALAYFPDVRIERTLRRHLESEENPQVRNALAASLRAVIQGRSIRDRTEGLTEPDRESLPPRLD